MDQSCFLKWNQALLNFTEAQQFALSTRQMALLALVYDTPGPHTAYDTPGSSVHRDRR
jgi:hypothetical protein